MTSKKYQKKVKKVTLKQKSEAVKEIVENLPKNEKKDTKTWFGRPWKMTDVNLQKLRLYFSVGMTDAQACYFCGISESTLYEYQRENPDFLEEKGILKDSISLQARLNVWWSVKKWDIADSKWWLMVKDKDFMNKLQIHNWDKPIMSEEDKVRYNQILENNNLW